MMNNFTIERGVSPTGGPNFHLGYAAPQGTETQQHRMQIYRDKSGNRITIEDRQQGISIDTRLIPQLVFMLQQFQQ